jgi:hypothetical protein
VKLPALRNLLTAIVLLIAAGFVSAHEIRPAYFELIEQPDGSVLALWKQPLMDTVGIAIAPHLSSGWLDKPPRREWQTPSHRIQEWTIPAPRAPLPDQELRIEGLDKTITDVLVRIRFSGGAEQTQLIKPEQPYWHLPAGEKSGLPVTGYLALGIEHIWTGIDHLLYVLGLILLVPNWRVLLRTITAFTIAHSITLGAAALHWIPVAAAPVEAVIALSIVYVAIELINARRGAIGIAQRAPWVIAFAFGLLHGFGFAGALAETGLPAGNIPLALLLFNIGIEVGQLAFVAVVLALLALGRRHAPRGAQWLVRGVPHAIGSLAAFWLIERTLVAWQIISH